MSVFDEEAEREATRTKRDREWAVMDAERAIVVAADMWFDADQDCSWEDKSEALAAAVGAWRKLKEER